MSTEQRNLIRELALLVQGNDGKGAAAGGIPIDRQVLGVGLHSLLVSIGAGIDGQRPPRSSHLDQVRVPRIAADVQVVVAGVLPRRLSEDVSCCGERASAAVPPRSHSHATALTILGRPDEAACHGDGVRQSRHAAAENGVDRGERRAEKREAGQPRCDAGSRARGPRSNAALLGMQVQTK